jgi:hypothetical protein
VALLAPLSDVDTATDALTVASVAGSRFAVAVSAEQVVGGAQPVGTA